MLIAALVTIVVAVVLGIAMRLSYAGSLTMLALLGVPYLAMAGWGLVRMYRDGEIAARLRPRSGDLALGASIATVLYLLAFGVRTWFASPGSAVQTWLLRIYLQLGDPGTLQRHWAVLTVAVLAIAVCEEITWRGLVMGSLSEVLGSRRAWGTAAVLYGAAHLPTLFVLRLPAGGLNPLVFVAALGCGLVWGVVAWRMRRLTVTMFAHALFTWAVVLQFPLWKLD